MPLNLSKISSAKSSSVKLLILLLLSLLPFCHMLVAETGGVQTLVRSIVGQGNNQSEPMAFNHDCCLERLSSSTFLQSLCPDCDIDYQAVLASAIDYRPVFILQYIPPFNLNISDYSPSVWQSNTVSRLIGSSPDIYLAKVSFLE